MAARISAAAINKPISAKLRPSPTTVVKNAVSVSAAMTIGDLVCQGLEWHGTDREFVWDSSRSLRMGFNGAFVVTPMSFCWNYAAERLAPGTTVKAILKKLVVQQAATPPMLVSQFATLTLLEPGKTVEDLETRLQRDAVPTFKAGLLFWPMFGVLNFRFVSVMNRPATSGMAGLLWSVYLSHQANQDITSEPLGQATAVYPLETSSPSATLVDARWSKKTADVMGGVSSVEIVEAAREDGDTSKKDAREGALDDGIASPEKRQKKKWKIVRRTTVVSV